MSLRHLLSRSNESLYLWSAPGEPLVAGIGNRRRVRRELAPDELGDLAASLRGELSGAGGPAFFSMTFPGRTLRAELVVPARTLELTWQHHEPGSRRPKIELSPDLHYQESVRRAVDAIEGGELDKVVLAHAFDLALEGPLDVAATLENLRMRHPGCRIFAVRRDDDAIFFGATPELLVRVRDGFFEIDVLAGTAPRDLDAARDAELRAGLLASSKDRHEHQLVLDAVLGAIAPFVDNVQYPHVPTFSRLTNLQHLHTPVRGRLRAGAGILDVAAALHPTPAVGGHPADRAQALIRELERFERDLYTGVVGWVDGSGDGELAVAIRCGLYRSGQVRVFAGAGIVRGSEPALEDGETRLKAMALLDALELR